MLPGPRDATCSDVPAGVAAGSCTLSGGVPQARLRRYRLRHDGEQLDVAQPICELGRDAECQVVLDDGLVSRRHARLYVGDDGLVVEDLGSRNGVFVNLRRIEGPTLLTHGDVIGLGCQAFEVIDLELAPRRRQATLPMPFTRSDTEGPDCVTITPRLSVLSPREREVFELIVLGYTQREIGSRLHVSVKTIETHRAHIADKLGCHTRAELVAYAITAGVLLKPNLDHTREKPG